MTITGDTNDDRSCVSLIALATWRLPADLAGGGVKGTDELRVEAIAADDEQILKKRWRPAGAMLRLVPEGLLPRYVALNRHAGGAVKTKVDEDFAPLNDGLGRSKRVFSVNTRDDVVDAKDLGVRENSARTGVERNKV